VASDISVVARCRQRRGGPKVAGFLLDKEIKYVSQAVENPARPFAAIVGGAKVSTKVPVLQSLLGKCDNVLIGGAMIFTFFQARGLKVGSSLVEPDFVESARKLEQMAKEKKVKLLLPSDVVIAKNKDDTNVKTVDINNIPDGYMGLDIGPKSIAAFKAALVPCKTIVWNGPMGMFEVKQFAKGTNELAQALAAKGKSAITIVGGGDTVAAVEELGLGSKMSHMSTGGGACLEMLEGQVLPGVAALDDA